MIDRSRATVATAALAGALFVLPAASFAAGATTNNNNSNMAATHMVHSSKQVEDAQQALNSKAGAQLKVDGVYGPKTRDAVKNFQQSHGLKATGRLDTQTQKARQTS
jgi:peptidoglycan hydrolase-like protein with peptidoglycan-binding domain